MSVSSARFERQVCLREIGSSGQARIEAGQLSIGPHLDELGREVARRYARGAGLVREAVGDGPAPRALSSFRHSAPRSVAAGAMAALAAIVEAVDP
jgi:hypothetical protein